MKRRGGDWRMLKLTGNEIILDEERLQEVEELCRLYHTNAKIDENEVAKQLAAFIPDLLEGLYEVNSELTRVRHGTRIVDGISNSSYDLSKLSLEESKRLESLLSKCLEVGSKIIN
jgi:hypothetical protein